MVGRKIKRAFIFYIVHLCNAETLHIFVFHLIREYTCPKKGAQTSPSVSLKTFKYR